MFELWRWRTRGIEEETRACAPGAKRLYYLFVMHCVSPNWIGAFYWIGFCGQNWLSLKWFSVWNWNICSRRLCGADNIIYNVGMNIKPKWIMIYIIHLIKSRACIIRKVVRLAWMLWRRAMKMLYFAYNIFGLYYYSFCNYGWFPLQ